MTPPPLSRREREIMDILYGRSPLSAAEVRERMPSPPSYSAVRAQLRILEEKGHVKHEQDGPRYLYAPVASPAKARRSALRALVRTFFAGSPEDAVAALIDDAREELGPEQLDRLAALIDQAREQGQ
ncbi:MAG: BlaI/MecI/CopY family transcriptional regulator [Myxococcota bacterium]